MKWALLAAGGMAVVAAALAGAAPQVRTRPGWQEGWTTVAVAPTKDCPPLGDCTGAERGLALQLRKAGKRVIEASAVAAVVWDMGSKTFDDADRSALLAKLAEREKVAPEAWVRIAAVAVHQERVKIKVQKVVEEEAWAVSTIGACEVTFTRADGSLLADGHGGLDSVTPDPGLTVHLEAARILAAMLAQK